MYQLRDYQAGSIEAIADSWRSGVKRSLVCLPTGSGKSPVIASLAMRLRKWFPNGNVLITVHTQELVEQLAKTYEAWSGERPGIYAAGLGTKEFGRVTVASVASVYRAPELPPFSAVLCDECDRVPVDGEGQYRTLFARVELKNPGVRYGGFTATPYRLGVGLVYGPGMPWEAMVYDADIRRLIDKGWLCPLVSKDGGAPSLVGVKHSGGEFSQASLETAMCDEALVRRAVDEILSVGRDRKHRLHFSTGVKHATLLQSVFRDRGFNVPIVHSGLSKGVRAEIIKAFKEGRVRDVLNINILAVGFDFPALDMISMLRPTESAGLYYQQIGRMLRPDAGKKNGLVLDLAGNIERHGPVDLLNKRITKAADGPSQPAPMKTCPQCDEMVHAAVRVCPECGFEFPPPALIKHSDTATTTAPLSETEGRQVFGVRYDMFPSRDGGPSQIRVSYDIRDVKAATMWLPCDAEAVGRYRFLDWLSSQRFVSDDCKLKIIASRTALEILPLLRSTIRWPRKIDIRQSGRYVDVVGYHHE